MRGNRSIIFSLLSLLIGASTMPAKCTESAKKPLQLQAHLDESVIEIGKELRPSVSLKNISSAPVKLIYIIPAIVVPEIWDTALKKKVANAPACYYDQVSARRETTLQPDQELPLFSMPLLVVKELPLKIGSDRLRGFWATKPGHFALKYSIDLKNFLPGETGTLHAADIAVTVVEPR